MHVLKNPCTTCGGYITIIPCRETLPGGKSESVVSHGVCIDCLQEITLPTEPYLDFVRKYCVNVDLDREVYVDAGTCIKMTQSALGPY